MAALFEQARFGARAEAFPTGRRCRVFNLTTVEEPGATGTDCPVHFSLPLPDLRCDFYEVTDVTGARRSPASRSPGVIRSWPIAATRISRGGPCVS